MIQTRYKGTRRSILQVSMYYDLSKKKEHEKYKACIFLTINNDMFSNINVNSCHTHLYP